MNISAINSVSNKKSNSAAKNSNNINSSCSAPMTYNINFEGGSLSAKVLKLAENKPINIQRQVLKFFGKHEELLKTYKKESDIGSALETAFNILSKSKNGTITKEAFAPELLAQLKPEDTHGTRFYCVQKNKVQYAYGYKDGQIEIRKMGMGRFL